MNFRKLSDFVKVVLSMIVTGNYILNIKINNIVIPIEPQKIEELTITQDIDRFLPVFKLRVDDPTGIFTHVIPFDKSSNSISIEIARGANHDNLNEFKFTVERRACKEEGKYEISGMLDIKNLFSSSKCRSFTGNLKTNLENLALNELEVSKTEIGKSLDYDKTVLQPYWDNGVLLRYLKNNVLGNNNEAGYNCFIKNIKGKTTFVFKSLDELYASAIQYKFIVGPDALKNHYPIYTYKIYDNSELITDYGAKLQKYTYFNYDTGENVDDSISVEDFTSLTNYFLINDDDISDSTFFNRLGRSNSFTSDFDGKVRNSYYNRLGRLISMWASTQGLENIAPGDMVRVIFGEMLQRKNLFLYQHTGYWMVKRVVHIIGQSFLTNFLLVRNGIDTDKENTLMKATKKKK